MSGRVSPFTLRVSVSGRTPADLERQALASGHEFFGQDATLEIVSGEASPDEEASESGWYDATVVIRQVKGSPAPKAWYDVKPDTTSRRAHDR